MYAFFILPNLQKLCLEYWSEKHLQYLSNRELQRKFPQGIPIFYLSSAPLQKMTWRFESICKVVLKVLVNQLQEKYISYFETQARLLGLFESSWQHHWRGQVFLTDSTLCHRSIVCIKFNQDRKCNQTNFIFPAEHSHCNIPPICNILLHLLNMASLQCYLWTNGLQWGLPSQDPCQWWLKKMGYDNGLLWSSNPESTREELQELTAWCVKLCLSCTLFCIWK